MVNIREGRVGGNNYLPLASSNQKGIASFYNEHFDIIDGAVSIKQSYFRSIFEDYIGKVTEVTYRELNVKSSYDNDTNVLTTSLYDSKEETVTSSTVTLPFTQYANSIRINKLTDSKFQIQLLNGSNILSTSTLDLSNLNSDLPMEISSPAEMDAILTSGATVGAVYKYTGYTTDSYENGTLYTVEVT